MSRLGKLEQQLQSQRIPRQRQVKVKRPSLLQEFLGRNMSGESKVGEQMGRAGS